MSSLVTLTPDLAALERVRCGAVGIPAGFRSDGTLVPGASLPAPDDVGPIFTGHAASLDEVHDRFVQPYSDSLARPLMWKELGNFAEVSSRVLGCVTLLVGGQFVVDCDEPEDILIVLDVPASDLAAVSGFHQWVLARLFDSRQASITDAELSIETEIVRSWDPTHHRHEEGQANRHRVHTLLRSPNTATRDAGHLSIWHCPPGGGDPDAFFLGGSSGADLTA